LLNMQNEMTSIESQSIHSASPQPLGHQHPYPASNCSCSPPSSDYSHPSPAIPSQLMFCLFEGSSHGDLPRLSQCHREPRVLVQDPMTTQPWAHKNEILCSSVSNVVTPQAFVDIVRHSSPWLPIPGGLKPSKGSADMQQPSKYPLGCPPVAPTGDFLKDPAHNYNASAANLPLLSPFHSPDAENDEVYRPGLSTFSQFEYAPSASTQYYTHSPSSPADSRSPSTPLSGPYSPQHNWDAHAHAQAPAARSFFTDSSMERGNLSPLRPLVPPYHRAENTKTAMDGSEIKGLRD